MIGLFNLFLPRIIADPFTILIIGDKLESEELSVKPTVRDLLLGNAVYLVVSFLSDATSLGVLKLFKLFIDTSSNP